jgi:eukaryotic-like serine/threonine-protein kinase
MSDERRDDEGRGEGEAHAGDSLAETLVDFGPVSTGESSARARSQQWSAGQTGPHAVGGRYELIALLGEGGMGNVYKARDLELDEVVALKTLKADLVDNDEAVERFRAEVKLARRVTHRNVARTYDLGVFEEIPYLTMEFIDGEDLGGLLEREGRVSVERFVELARPLCEGLAAAHQVGVVHRDLKPHNVILAADGRVAITDFGIARATERTTQLTGEGIPIGTPAYMAPEQVEGKAELDPRADIYALGVMFFEMLSGELPFDGKTPMSTALARLMKDPPLLDEVVPGVPAPLVALIKRCMARDREGRIQTVEEVLDALDALSTDGAAPASRVGRAQTLGPAPTAKLSATPDGADSLPSLAEPARQEATAVAVLPFRSSGEAEDAYVADGLTEDIIDELSMSQTLRVRPRGAVMPYKGTQSSPRELGEALSVQVIVDGSIRRAGERLRVRVGLVSVRDGFQIWAKRFKGTAADLFEISEEAARAIARALTADELATPQPALADSEAVDLYLKARHVMHQNWFTDLTPAVDLFEEALEQAPNDPRILSGAAMARSRATFYQTDRRDEYLSKARGYAERALAIAPGRPEPRLALARMHFACMEYGRALAHLRPALSTAPSNADAHDLMGRLLREIGPLDTAIGHIEAAIELNPQMFRARFGLAQTLALLEDWERVDSLLATPVESDADANAREAARSRLDLWRDEPRWLDAAGEERPLNADSPPIRRMSKLRRDLARRGHMNSDDRTFYQFVIDQGLEGSRLDLIVRQLGCEALAFSQEYEELLDELEQAIDHGLLDRMWLQHCPLFEPVRDEPRFQACIRRVDERIEAQLAPATDPTTSG